MVGISTAWDDRGRRDTREMLRQIRDLGFNAIEVSYNFSHERLGELLSCLKETDIKVVSVHNFCPLPAEKRKRYTSDYYRLSSQDEDERRRAVDYTKRTIDTACGLSCGVVVIHAGVVELKADFVRNLMRLYHQGKVGSGEYN